MTDKLTKEKIDEWLLSEEVEFYLKEFREKHKVDPESPVLYTTFNRLVEDGVLKRIGRGLYRKIYRPSPVKVFIPGRERRPPVDLRFPKDDKGTVLGIADNIIIREGDLIIIGGVKSKGKTTLCLLFCAENINKNPILMGNEYTVLVNETVGDDVKLVYKPAPRFFNRLDTMKEWVNWTDEQGEDKFTLLPIRADYAEHIVKDKINIIDWINLDGNALYDIGKILEGIKSNLGRGVAIIALQKSELATNPRGGQFVRDFSDVEILLDGYNNNQEDILMTIKGVKEKPRDKPSIVGRTYAYTIINDGTQIINFREVKKCPTCNGQGYKQGHRCEMCDGAKYIDKDTVAVNEEDEPF